MRQILRVGACVASVLVVGACGGSTTDANGGSAAGTATTSAPPALPIVSPEKLDAGAYPTKPRPPLGEAGDPANGKLIQAKQMADFVIGPWDVDETLVSPYLESFYVVDDPTVLARMGPEPVAAVASKHGLVNGFASAREAIDTAVMVQAVLRFPDPPAAAAASIEMNTAAAAQPVAGVTPTVAAIPGHPEAAASTYPFTPRGSDRPRATIRSFAPHGPYVFMQFVQSVDGFDAAAALVAKAIDAQAPVIDEFKAADVNALGTVAVDPTGLLARTVPLSPGVAAAGKNSVYRPRGAAHFQSNPPGSTTLFKDSGVTAVSMAGVNVYEAKDPASAGMIIDAFNGEVTGSEGSNVAASVPALPNSSCTAFPQGFYCVAPADRYAIEAQGPELADLQQRVAAQYIMLTAK